jgi:hypothetical protein
VTFTILAKELWLPSLESARHRTTKGKMSFVGLSLLFGASFPLRLALLVGRMGQSIFHLASEFVDALWFRLGATTSIAHFLCRRRTMTFVVATFYFYIFETNGSIEASNVVSFVRSKRAQILSIVVRVIPSGAWWARARVNKELVMGFWVVLTYPACWQWTMFVLHAAP